MSLYERINGNYAAKGSRHKVMSNQDKLEARAMVKRKRNSGQEVITEVIKDGHTVAVAHPHPEFVKTLNLPPLEVRNDRRKAAIEIARNDVQNAINRMGKIKYYGP